MSSSSFNLITGCFSILISSSKALAQCKTNVTLLIFPPGHYVSQEGTPNNNNHSYSGDTKHKFLGNHSNVDTPDLINLSGTEDTTSSTSSDTGGVGPRHVSVRIPAGSNNILLDNATASFTSPVLYKCRNSANVEVHTRVTSRSGVARNEASASSDEDASYSSLSRMRTETRI